MTQIAVRALEFHNNRMWNWKSVEAALDVMPQLGLNTLVFHQNDIIDHLVLPKAYFDEDLMWARWPIRLCWMDMNRTYIDQVIRKARSLDIDFYFQVKEIWYPESLLELYPELMTPAGCVCPNDPFWFEFLKVKLAELLDVFPGIAGIIASPATRETKISISTNPCECDRCRATDPRDWYRNYLQTFHNALAARGKTFVVRDFSYSADQQHFLIEAAAECSKDIVIALKNVPQDFWPTFPDNPKIGQTNGLTQWMEYDVWGQYCGLGVFPVSLVEDIRHRLDYSRERGVTGVIYRTDWELLNESSVFNSFNMLNLVAGALLAKDPGTPLEYIYQTWTDYGLFSSLTAESCTAKPVVPTSPDAVTKLMNFMKASWAVMEKTSYVRGHVFQYNSQFEHSMAAIHKVMLDYHGREKWEPGSSQTIQPTDENLEIIFEEKRAAVEEVERLESILQPETLGLPDKFTEDIRTMLNLYGYYVRGFDASARAYFLARKAAATGSGEDVGNARAALEQLELFCRNLEERLLGTFYPPYVCWMMDPKQLRSLKLDIAAELDSCTPKPPSLIL